jgi:hypothetical protein
MISPITEKQFDRVRTRYPAAEISLLPSGSALVTIPAVGLPQGWSAPETAIHFIVPIGYPGPAPDCFWANASLLLANRAAPQASNIQAIPESNIQARWFSWHVVDAQNNWNPNRDDLMTYVAIILDRFRHPQ